MGPRVSELEVNGEKVDCGGARPPTSLGGGAEEMEQTVNEQNPGGRRPDL